MADEAKGARTVAKSKFTRAEKSLMKALDTVVPMSTLSRRFEDFKKAYTEAEDSHEDYTLLLQAVDVDAIANEEQWIEDLTTRYELLEVKYDEKSKALADAQIPPPAAAAPNPAPAPDAEPNQSKSMFKTERMKFPPFDGNIRKYAKWKEEFEMHIKPSCTPEQLAFVLKSYLCDELRDEMNAFGGTADEIWERLDERFGNQSRLVDNILAEVRAIEHCRDDDELTLNMIKTVERCYNELKSMKREGEMNNTTIISMIEGKMTSEMGSEWIKAVTKKGVNHDDKFTYLKALFDEWRSRIEYKIANIRAMSCPPPPRILGNVNFSQTDGGKKTSCWLHNSVGDHPIWRCRLFQSKPVEERVNLVLQHGACVVCLEKGHQTAFCVKKFRCTVDNCNERHNKLLHRTINNGNNNNKNANNKNSSHVNDNDNRSDAMNNNNIDSNSVAIDRGGGTLSPSQ